ncbi:hypothetical protein D9758_009869 [Tetrapyrgos nigripes]|uniref:Uncharacterized protein n=1 Tax=Tetrapyrgos nigripes TaxID=182062 RepID=A0A8H5GN87_9AGAR|nr:hypothetical protein D9758_009869 [Tetrapyrgos nigripes]
MPPKVSGMVMARRPLHRTLSVFGLPNNRGPALNSFFDKLGIMGPIQISLHRHKVPFLMPWGSSTLSLLWPRRYVLPSRVGFMVITYHFVYMSCVIVIVRALTYVPGEASVEAQDNEVYRKVVLSRGEMLEYLVQTVTGLILEELPFS